MRLRKLEIKDAPLMLEWMHDSEIQKSFKRNMLDATIEDAVSFCKTSKIPSELEQGINIHFAIADDNDEYLGTISLKDINLKNRTAEYAIVTRKKVHGKGIAHMATGLLLKKAFFEYKLHRVYLNVLANNYAAIKLYENSGFLFEGESREHLKIGDLYMNLKWYGILESEYDENMFSGDCPKTKNQAVRTTKYSNK